MDEHGEYVDTADPLGCLFLEKLRPYPCYGGLDLAAVSDLTGLVLAWPIDPFVYIYPWAWIPEHDIAGRSKRDGVRYDLWAEAGYIETTPGNVTDWAFCTDRIIQLRERFDIQCINIDPAYARDVNTRLIDAGLNMVEHRQGFLSMTAPAKRFESLVLSRRLVHTGHPVMRWCVDCTSIDRDAARNIKPVKPKGDSNKRIDLTVAAVMAISGVMANEGDGDMALTFL